MRLITIYETFDHEQFPTLEEALHYEYEARRIANFIRNEKNLFLGKENPIVIPEEEDLWEQFFEIEKAYNNCAYIRISEEIPEDIRSYLTSMIGIRLPVKTGLYVYDWDNADTEWKKVGE